MGDSSARFVLSLLVNRILVLKQQSEERQKPKDKVGAPSDYSIIRQGKHCEFATMPSPSSSAPPQTSAPPPTHTPAATPPPSGLSYAIAFFVLGASAGMTMYTRRTGQMLSRMEQITENQLKRNPPKYGPPTRAEFEKMRNRWSSSD
jgi:hypothetical protein